MVRLSYCASVVLWVRWRRSRGRVHFFFTGRATTGFSSLSLHDALPIPPRGVTAAPPVRVQLSRRPWHPVCDWRDRKSTRLNSSHQIISYAVFCLKKHRKNTAHLTQLPGSREVGSGEEDEQHSTKLHVLR